MLRIPLMFASRALAAAAAVSLISGCNIGGSIFGDFELCPNGNEAIGTIKFRPELASIRVGDAVGVQYQVLKPDGSMALCYETVSITIEDATIATLTSGFVRGVAVGQTTLRASSGSKSWTTTVTVTSDALAQLAVSVSHPALLVGQVTRLSATAQDSSGSAVVLQSTPYVSANPTIASVTAGGTIVARGVGTATITLTRGGKTASTTISISSGAPAIPMTAISAGGTHSCALASGESTTGDVPAGAAFCWGTGVGGTSVATLSPARVAGGLTFSSISAGALLTCGISTAGSAYCWGWNTSGELGIGNRTANHSPQRVGGSATYLSVVAADQLACGLQATGRVDCWGASNLSEAITVPTPIAGTMAFVDLSRGMSGPGIICGRTSAGAVYCWSRMSRWNAVPPELSLNSGAFASISVGGPYRCGLSAAGSAACWGSITEQLGPGVPAGSYSTPVTVPDGRPFQSIATSGAFFCGMTTTGTWCHGRTGLVNSGGAGAVPRLVPMLDPAVQFTKLSGGGLHACALDTRGAVWCWGEGPSLGLLGISMPPEPLQLRFD